ncbi:MAG: M23 family metallopeptidase [Pseudomonadota bacterium]
MTLKTVLVALAGCVLLSACDAVRYPGDGGEPPRTPETRDPNAPPPPPPTEPVTDPYGTGEDPSSAPGSEDIDPTPISDPVTDTPGSTVDPQPAEPAPEPAPAEYTFSYFAPGALTPGSGTGAPDQLVHAPGIAFPIRTAPAYLQSMVWGFGGGVGGGDECDSRNYTYPWRDNFCETRSSNRNSPFCPVGRIHQGQDIRVGTPSECEVLRGTPEDDRMLHEVVAVEDGVVYEIGTYTVKLRAGGRIYRYMHLNMDALQVSAGDSVLQGDVLGYVSKDFGGTPTTFHLHFEIIQNTEEHGWVHVPPYLSLVEAYERREGGPGELIDTAVATASAPVFPPEGMEIIE